MQEVMDVTAVCETGRYVKHSRLFTFRITRDFGFFKMKNDRNFGFIDKDFNGDPYRGYIVDVDEDVDNGGVLCSAQYEDGDGEDLSVAECKMTVEYRHKIESGEIKEQEIGQE